jgi:phosphatidylinositol kinase/protein kinase (PI-3  family)
MIDHRVDRVLELENFALTSTVIFFDKSPVATASSLSDVRTWAVRLLAIELTLSVKSSMCRPHLAHPLDRRGRPSGPDSPRATRVTSEANERNDRPIV